jgi:hypothetical protein
VNIERTKKFRMGGLETELLPDGKVRLTITSTGNGPQLDPGNIVSSITFSREEWAAFELEMQIMRGDKL